MSIRGTVPGSKTGTCAKRVTWELGRANCLLVEITRKRPRDGLLAVLVEHSTDVVAASYDVKWGSDAKATHRREGEAGHNVLCCGTTGGT